MSYPQSSQSSTNIEDINPNVNFDFKENSPFQEGIMSKTFQRPDKTFFFSRTKRIGYLISKGNLIHKYLLKQTDIDKILGIIQRKVLKGTHLPVKIEEIQAGYLHSYSITELELCGLAINIASFSHLLKRVDFNAIVDHLAIMHIIKSKVEPAATRIKRLLELISLYSFNLYYMKGKI